MPHTDGRWTQGTSNPDLQLFIGAQKFKDLAGLASFYARLGNMTVSNKIFKCVARRKSFILDGHYKPGSGVD